MLPIFAMTCNLAMVSVFPTISLKTRGRCFSTHGNSPSFDETGQETTDGRSKESKVVSMYGEERSPMVMYLLIPSWSILSLSLSLFLSLTDLCFGDFNIFHRVGHRDK